MSRVQTPAEWCRGEITFKSYSMFLSTLHRVLLKPREARVITEEQSVPGSNY